REQAQGRGRGQGRRTAIRTGPVGAAAGLLPAAHRTPTAGPLRRLPASGLPPGLSAAVPRLRPAALPRLRPTARLRPAVPGIRPAGLVTPNSTRSSYFWGPWGGEHTPCGPPFRARGDRKRTRLNSSHVS